jgi:hypothetical protein
VNASAIRATALMTEPRGFPAILARRAFDARVTDRFAENHRTARSGGCWPTAEVNELVLCARSSQLRSSALG